jgi:hypothetical protein
MKHFSFTLLFIFSVALLSAQYATPGTGVNWSLPDLVDNSEGAVSLEPSGQYTFHQDVVISANDTLSLLSGVEVNMLDDVLVTVQGVMIAAPPENEIVFFKAADGFFKGFRFDNSIGSSIARTYFKKAGGAKLVTSDVAFLGCDFSEFSQNYSSGTIDLFQSSPVIESCSFSNNQGPAVMSGANSSSSPQIIGCEIHYNVAANVNMPQINLGTSAETDSIRIVGCEIIGNRENIMAGGIAITTLAGGNLKARIEGNIIKDNRYGITAYGNNVGSVIRGNEIANNDTQGLPLLGGSGINFFGNTSNQSLVTANIITGNLWGITIQQEAQPNFGQLEGAIVNPGENQIFDNGNEGEIFNLYNNTPDPIMAQNNWWGSADPAIVESGIFHQFDDPLLGEVIYLPLFNPPVAMDEIHQSAGNYMKIYPNPATEFVFIKVNDVDFAEQPVIDLMNATGKFIADYPIGNSRQELRIELPENLNGVFFMRLKTSQFSETQKLILH